MTPSAMPSTTHYKCKPQRFLFQIIISILHLFNSARAALRYQFIIDSLDVWLPATNLGLVNLSDGILGFTGLVILLTYLQWRTYKLKFTEPLHPSWRYASNGSQSTERSDCRQIERHCTVLLFYSCFYFHNMILMLYGCQLGICAKLCCFWCKQTRL